MGPMRTHAYRPNRFTGRDPGVRPVGVGEISRLSAVCPALRVRARSRSTSASWAECATTEKTMVIASPVLLASSAQSMTTTAVPATAEAAKAVAGHNHGIDPVSKWREWTSLHHRRWCLRLFEKRKKMKRKRCSYRLI